MTAPRAIQQVVSDWAESRIGDVGTVQTGSTPSTSDRSLYGREFLFVSPADMGSNKYINRSQKMLSQKGFNLSRHFPSGSVLFVCIGSTIGKVGLATTDLTSNQQINAVTPGPNLESEYLYYALVAIAESVKSQAGEQAVPLVNKSDFSGFKIRVPCLEEQRLIAGFLGDADATVTSLERLIAKKQAIKQGMMQQLLTGKTRLPGFTGGWELIQLGDIATIRKGQQLSRADMLMRGNIDVWNGGVVPSGLTDQPNAEGHVVTVSEGGNSCGWVGMPRADFWLGGHCYALMLRRSGMTNGFLYQALKLKEQEIMALRVGSGLPNIQKKALAAFKIYVPQDPSEAKMIDVFLGDADREIESLKVRLQLIQSIKQGMMQELLTGRTRLTPSGESE